MSAPTSPTIGLLPLILVAVTALAAMLLDLRSKPNPRLQNSCTVIGLLLAALSVIPIQSQISASGQPFTYWSGIIAVDGMASMFTALACLSGALALIFSIDYLQTKRAYPGEYITLIPFVVLGLSLACSTKELLTFFLAFELMSLPLYAMAAWGRFDLKSSEAGFKYFINGAVSSAIMFYGISLIFGTTGSTFFDQLAINFDLVSTPRHAFVLGSLMFAGALLFKIAVAPFHFWAPDVYEGAPAPAGMFISTAPKATIIAFIMRAFWSSLAIQSMEFRLEDVWTVTFCSLALLSMTWGNIAALRQSNIKRLMAFSGIAQIGYTMLGVMTAARSTGVATMGISAAVFYITMYSFANLAAWSVIVLVEYQRGSSEISAYKGLAKSNPFLAFVLLVSLLSLAGAPPLAGFVGKFYLFRTVFLAHSGWWWVVLAALVNSVISLYYYYGILRPVYFEEPADNQAASGELQASWSVRVGLTVCLIMIAFVGLCPTLVQMGASAGAQVLSSAVLP
ncbi:NADH-quinone oxidoreductase subunit N [bacterium]|nr:NADH-quinone oxidoreductase subunit N [bacterium]